MTAKCVSCGLDWNVSIYQKIPRTGYICPHCESRLRAGETLPNIQASQKAPRPEPLTRATATTSPSPAARNTSTAPTSTTCSRT